MLKLIFLTIRSPIFEVPYCMHVGLASIYFHPHRDVAQKFLLELFASCLHTFIDYDSDFVICVVFVSDILILYQPYRDFFAISIILVAFFVLLRNVDLLIVFSVEQTSGITYKNSIEFLNCNITIFLSYCDQFVSVIDHDCCSNGLMHQIFA